MAKSFGAWAFLIGVILAVIVGAASQGNLNATWVSILVLLGLIVGFLNVTDKEVTPFMMAGTVLVIVTSLGGNVLEGIAGVGGLLSGAFSGVNLLFVPATIIVALKSVFTLAKD